MVSQNRLGENWVSQWMVNHEHEICIAGNFPMNAGFVSSYERENQAFTVWDKS